jgi:hypothetical protein
VALKIRLGARAFRCEKGGLSSRRQTFIGVKQCG